jgi:hypothetical protein
MNRGPIHGGLTLGALRALGDAMAAARAARATARGMLDAARVWPASFAEWVHYAPAAPELWAPPPPDNVADALDRLAANVGNLRPIP